MAQNQGQGTLRAAPGRDASKKISARVANSTAKVSRQKAGKRGGKAGSYDD